MPRPGKGARLWLRPERRIGGKLIRTSGWVILDKGRHIATGCTADQTSKAEACLAAYIAAKYQPSRKERDIEGIAIADVLSIYHDDRVSHLARPAKIEERLARLNEFWGDRTLAEINGDSCRQYTVWRGSNGGARRDFEDLRAAVNHHAKEGLHRGVVRVSLPPKGRARDRWLTRKEVADLIRVCWRAREVQTVHCGAAKGMKIQTDKRPLRHLARFILIAIYTGTRAGAVATASSQRAEGRSYVDLERGVFYRLAEGRAETNKRQPPVPIPPRLLAHLRRWVDKGICPDHFVEWSRQPVKSVKTAFKSAVRLAGIQGRVTPHTLRHTAATWLMQAGVDKWEAAGFLGMSVEMLDRVYGHHHPDHLRRAAQRIGYHRVSLAISLAQPRRHQPRNQQAIENIGGGCSPSPTCLCIAIPC
jgi:integrase